MNKNAISRVRGWIVPAFVTVVLTGSGCGGGGGPEPGIPPGPMQAPPAVRAFLDMGKAAAKDPGKMRKTLKEQNPMLKTSDPVASTGVKN
jgi:hypothetical protein